jgi:hypothetical protein
MGLDTLVGIHFVDRAGKPHIGAVRRIDDPHPRVAAHQPAAASLVQPMVCIAGLGSWKTGNETPPVLQSQHKFQPPDHPPAALIGNTTESIL